MEKKYIVAYLGSGNSIVYYNDFPVKYEAVEWIKKVNTVNSSNEGNRFFIIEAYEVYR